MIRLNNAKNETTKTGNGTAYAVGAVVSGNQSVANIGDQGVTVFRCANTAGTIWEFFVGQYTASNTRVTRTQFLSSITGSPIVWTSGTKHLSVSPSAEQEVIGTVNEIDVTDNETTAKRVVALHPVVRGQISDLEDTAVDHETRIDALEESSVLILTGQTTDETPTDIANSEIIVPDASTMFVRAYVVGHRESDHSGCIFEIKAGIHRDDGETPSLPGTAVICNEIVDTICNVTFEGDEQNEIQSFQFFDDFSGGDYTLTLAGQTTDPIGFDADAAAIETEIIALSNVTDATATGGPPLTDAVEIEITDPAETNFSQLTLDISGLTGGSIDATIETTTQGAAGSTSATASWSLDENSGTRDDAAGSADLTETGMIGVWAGVIDDAAQGFDESNYLSTPTQATIEGGDRNFSLSLWAKAASLGNTATLIYKANGAVSVIDYWLAFGRDGGGATTVQLIVGTTGSDVSITVTIDVTLDDWHHVAASIDRDNDLMSLYLDGALIGTTDLTGIVLQDSGGDLIFGGGPAGAELIGAIDQTDIFDFALDTADVLLLYNGGAGTTYPQNLNGIHEVQELTLIGSPVQGFAALTIGGEVVNIPFDATAGEAETLINAALGASTVDVTGGPLPDTPLVITWANGGDIDDSSVDPDPLKYAITTIQDGTAGSQPCDVDLDIDPDTGEVFLYVIGQAAETFEWTANVLLVTAPM